MTEKKQKPNSQTKRLRTILDGSDGRPPPLIMVDAIARVLSSHIGR